MLDVGAHTSPAVIPVLSRDPVSGSARGSSTEAERTGPRLQAGVTEWWGGDGNFHHRCPGQRPGTQRGMPRHRQVWRRTWTSAFAGEAIEGGPVDIFSVYLEDAFFVAGIGAPTSPAVIPALSRDPVNGSARGSATEAERTGPRLKAGVTEWWGGDGNFHHRCPGQRPGTQRGMPRHRQVRRRTWTPAFAGEAIEGGPVDIFSGHLEDAFFVAGIGAPISPAVIAALSRDPVSGSARGSSTEAERTGPRLKAGVTKWGVRAMRYHFAHRRAP